jgi:Fe-S-cluster containining protein
MPGSLAPEDLPRLAGSDDYESTLTWAREHLSASEGALVALRGDSESRFRVGTLVLRSREDGSCIFLTEECRCAVHSEAPFSCAFTDMHMDVVEGQQRSLALLKVLIDAHANADVYAQVWTQLWDEGLRATPLQERRSKLETAVNRIERKKRRPPSINPIKGICDDS